MSGFEILRDVAAHNAAARDAEYDRLADALTARREGIDTSLWRCLPDADDVGVDDAD
ncbi:hypothetical protein [Streptomyces kanamyceticus]|uniref:hypothetical protein n=1 Tax=Streptomyces kanamyceticus TaxID=1967 RepID=UPI000AFEB10D|nr:hypothetical protein [Streptomyces kanamyceticus]